MHGGRGRAGRALGAALVVLLAASGCIGGDDSDDPPVSEGEPTDDSVLRLGIGGPLVVDPAEGSLASPSDLMVLDLLHDGLTRADEDGNPQPALAADWTANPASTVFEFNLAATATFTSGRAVTSEDATTSLERVMAAGDSSLAALSLEAVKGFRAFVDGEAEHVSGLIAKDADTVRVELTTPLSVLPVVLSSPMLPIVDADTVDGDLASLDLTGSWTVTSADDDNVVLESRGDTGSLETIELRAHDDEDAAYDTFEAGEVDWAMVPPLRYEQAVEDHGDGAFAPFQAELFFGMNLRTPLLARQPIRQAIMLAIDRDAIVEEAFADLADPLATVVPAGIAGHDPERCAACAPDPERAAEVIAFAFPDGNVPTVHIDYDETPAQATMAELVADDLEDVGIPTELRPLPLDEYKSFVVSGDQELFSFGWIGEYRSPDAYLAPLFGSTANDNLTGYRSASVDLLLAGARANADMAANAEVWARVEQTVLEAAVVVPIAQFRTQAVVADRVEGLRAAVDGTVDWSQVSLRS